MSAPRVIPATFHNYRTVLGRKVLQLVFEVPIEQQNETLRLLGYPNAAEPSWYAIARLTEKPAASEASRETLGNVEHPLPAPPQAPKDRRPFHTLPLAQQCAIRCEDDNFVRYLDDLWLPIFEENEKDVARTVRAILRVKSRAELSTNHKAANLWRTVENTYQGWLTDQRYADSRR